MDSVTSYLRTVHGSHGVAALALKTTNHHQSHVEAVTVHSHFPFFHKAFRVGSTCA